MIYLYDAQSDVIHEIKDIMRGELRQLFGYSSTTERALYAICHAMIGHLGDTRDEEIKCIETRLFCGKRLLTRNPLVHDIRTSFVEDLLMPADPKRITLFAKLRLRDVVSSQLYDYRYLVSRTPFDKPMVGPLDKL